MTEFNQNINKKEGSNNSTLFSILSSPKSNLKRRKYSVSNANCFNKLNKINNSSNKNTERIKPTVSYKNNNPITYNKINNRKFAQNTEAFLNPIKKNLLKKINSLYNDSSTLYNIMIINNILSKKFSTIKQKYLEKLNEFESRDFLKIYTFNEIRYFLKYLSVCYDKFHIHFPNYCKDHSIYDIMMSYLSEKQKLIEEIKEDNRQILLYQLRNNEKKTTKNKEVVSKILDSKAIDDINSEEENYYKRNKISEIGLYADSCDDSLRDVKSLVERINNAEDIFNLPKSVSNKDIYTLTEVLFKKKSLKKKTNPIQNFHHIFRNEEKEFEIFAKNIITIKRSKSEKKTRKILTIEDPLIQSKLKKFNRLHNKGEEKKKIKIKIDLRNKDKYVDLRKSLKTEVYYNNLLRNTIYLLKNKNTFSNNINIKNEKSISPNNNYNINFNVKTSSYILDKLKMRALKSSGNYNLYKNQKYLIKNMNDNLNDLRFNIQILLNSPDKINSLTSRKKDDFPKKQLKLFHSVNKEKQYKSCSKQREKKGYLTDRIKNCKKNIIPSIYNNKKFKTIKKGGYFMDSVFTSSKKYFYDIYKNNYERTETENDRIKSNILTLNKELKKTESLNNRNYHRNNLTLNFALKKSQKNCIDNYKVKRVFDNIYGDKNINKGRSKCLYFQSKLKSEDKDKINQFFCNDIKKKNKKVLLIKC